jgi:membrane protein implicated in regulation of membrane protease activity
MCHLVLFLPVFALPVFWLLPPAEAAALYGAVLVASLALYAYTVKAMRQPRLNGAEAMLGEEGRVLDVDASGARLLFHGELWHAQVEGEPVAPGEQALIVGVEGLYLKIRRKAARTV